MTTDPSERLARAALSRLGEPGDPRLARLVHQLGAVEVYRLLRDEREVDGLRSEVAQRLRGLDPEGDLQRAAERGIRWVCPGDEEWPEALQDLDRAATVNGRGGSPLGLWVTGPLALAEALTRSVAVVGSRSATTYGAEVSASIAANVAGAGVSVVSGAAYGIDVAAHRGALAARGWTVAVLACGVDRVYPAGNQAVIDHIGRHGLVVSELPPGSAPTKLRFLSRNRLIAAMTRGTVVVEAALRSGALSTANWASRLGRVLMGVPGPVSSAPSEGVHELLRRGEAQLVCRGEHVLELVSATGQHVTEIPRGARRPHDGLDLPTVQTLDAVPAAVPAPTGSVARTAGMDPVTTARALAELERRGLVQRVAQGWRLAP